MRTEIFKTKKDRLQWVVRGLKLQIKKIDEEMAIQEEASIRQSLKRTE